MKKGILDKKLCMLGIVVVVLIFYIPMLESHIYISSDEFSSIAAPAILSGNDWTPTVSYHSYHGIGFTILMTPFFAFIKNGIAAHRIILVFVLVLKILFAELLYCFFMECFHLDIHISFIFSIMYICGAFGCDEYGLSVLSELPFAFCIFVSIYVWMKYISTKKNIYWIIASFFFSYTYLIHSRCLILYISFIITMGVYIIREKPGCISILKKMLFFVIMLGIMYCLLQIFQEKIYIMSEGEELINDPSVVLSASSYQLKKLLHLEMLVEILKICFSLIATQCMVSLGIGTIALLCCIYVIFVELFNHKKLDKGIFYLALISILCIFGMNFAVGIQSVGRIGNGDYAWLTYIRYAEPFWIFPYIVFVYMFKQMLSNELRNIIIIGASFVGGFINLCLAQVLSEGYGLSWSVLDRLFYQPGFEVKGYFFVFVKMMYFSTALFILVWNSKYYRKKCLFLYMCMMMTVNYQYEKYYINKEKEEYEEVDRSEELIDILLKYNPNMEINADPNTLIYSSKLQFLVFDATLKYELSTKNFPDGNIMFTDVDDYIFDGLNVHRIQIDKGEYVYVSDDNLYKMINLWLMD